MLRARAWWAAVALLIATPGSLGCGEASPPVSAPAPTTDAPFRFEVRDGVGPACEAFWQGVQYVAGTPCAEARAALRTVYEEPPGDAGGALRSLDRLCAEGMVEACDAGRELMWKCSSQSTNESTPWLDVCTVLQLAGRALPPNSDEPAWLDGALPLSLSGCFVVERVQTCAFVGNGRLDPIESGPCEISATGCPPLSGQIDLDDGRAASSCPPEPHPAAEVGTIHCFDDDHWSFFAPRGPRIATGVRWQLLPIFDGVMALTEPRGVAAMTIEGTGALPVMRIARTRAWLRRAPPVPSTGR